MKEFTVVTIKNLTDEYEACNLKKNMIGVVIKPINQDKSLVLFINEKILDDYAFVEMKNTDLEICNEEFPKQLIYKIKNSNKFNAPTFISKNKLEIPIYEECDEVELLVEDEKYSKYGVHKGAIGYIAYDKCFQDSILVDFSWLDKDFNYFGDIIETDLKDIRKIEKKPQ